VVGLKFTPQAPTSSKVKADASVGAASSHHGTSADCLSGAGLHEQALLARLAEESAGTGSEEKVVAVESGRTMLSDQMQVLIHVLCLLSLILLHAIPE
jgi:hypothetical protein